MQRNYLRGQTWTLLSPSLSVEFKHILQRTLGAVVHIRPALVRVAKRGGLEGVLHGFKRQELAPAAVFAAHAVIVKPVVGEIPARMAFAACRQCHAGWNFTDDGFHDTGVRGKDRGRGQLLPLEAMQHAFKTPTLRNADQRGPYMHNGSERSLQDVLELYAEGGREKRPSLAPEIVPLHLTAREK